MLWAISELGDEATAYSAYKMVKEHLAKTKQPEISVQQVYQTVKSLRKRDLVEDSPWEEPKQPRRITRKYIRLTVKGWEELEQALDVIHDSYWIMTPYS